MIVPALLENVFQVCGECTAKSYHVHGAQILPLSCFDDARISFILLCMCRVCSTLCFHRPDLNPLDRPQALLVRAI